MDRADVHALMAVRASSAASNAKASASSQIRQHAQMPFVIGVLGQRT
jgi:hypothetical protein